MIWYMIWHDMIYDVIWYDMIWYMIWHDMIYDVIWYDMIWYDMIYDMTWYMWYDMIWYDMIWYDMIWYDMIWYDMIWYDVIYLLTAIGLSLGGSSTVHIYTQTIHRTTQGKQNMQNRTHITIRIHKRNNKNIWFTKLNKSIQNIQPYIKL